jgi:hypothetical protein
MSAVIRIALLLMTCTTLHLHAIGEAVLNECMPACCGVELRGREASQPSGIPFADSVCIPGVIAWAAGCLAALSACLLSGLTRGWSRVSEGAVLPLSAIVRPVSAAGTCRLSVAG